MLSILAFMVRLPGIGALPLWYDETFSLKLVNHSWSAFWWESADDVHPPLYYLILRFWMALWGNGPVAGRTLSVLWAAGLPAAIYLMARRMSFSRKTALGSSTLAALCPYTLYYAQEMRMYTQFATLCALFLAASGRMLEESIRAPKGRSFGLDKRLATWLLAGAAMLYTHNLGVAVCFGVFVWAVLLSRLHRSANPLRMATGGAALLTILYFPELPRIFNRLFFHHGLNWLEIYIGKADFRWIYWIGDALVSGPRTVQWEWLFTDTFITGPSVAPAPLPLRLTALLAVGGVCIVPAVAALLQGRINNGELQAIVRGSVPILLLVASIGLPLLISVWKPILFAGQRYCIYAIPPFLLAIGHGLEKTTRAWRILILFLIGLCWGHYFWSFYLSRFSPS